ncbi:MAG: cytochrome c-type biogenesis protein CcmH [Myxococcota bacterium]
MHQGRVAAPRMRRAHAPRAAGVMVAMLLALAADGTAAQEAADDPEGPPPWAYAMAGELLSPFCPGRTLTECPSPQAESLRMWIIVQAAAGRSRQDIEAELYERYGDDIRSTPRTDGIGITAYLLPAFAFFGGGGLLAWFLVMATRRGGGGGGGDGAPPPAPLDAEQERRLDAALRGEDADEAPKDEDRDA